MTSSVPPNALMVTFLHDLMGQRGISRVHLADLLQPVPEATVTSWLNGWVPVPVEAVSSVASALRVNVVEFAAAWLINGDPSLEDRVRRLVLDRIGSSFPASADAALRAPRPRLDVADPHDAARAPYGTSNSRHVVRKRASGSRWAD